MEGNVAYERKGGDPAALESLAAATVVEGTIDHPRVVPNPLETRSVLAEWRDGALTVHLSSQAPHLMAEEFAKAFGMAQSSVQWSLRSSAVPSGASSTWPRRRCWR